MSEDFFERIARKSAQAKASDAFTHAGKSLFPALEREAIACRIEEIMMLFCKGKSIDRTDAKKFFATVKAELEKM